MKLYMLVLNPWEKMLRAKTNKQTNKQNHNKEE